MGKRPQRRFTRFSLAGFGYVRFASRACWSEKSSQKSPRDGWRYALRAISGANRTFRLHTIWMDGGYRGEEFMRWVMDVFRWIVEIVLRPLEKKSFVILPKRWVVERTFGWPNWCRRLSGIL